MSIDHRMKYEEFTTMTCQQLNMPQENLTLRTLFSMTYVHQCHYIMMLIFQNFLITTNGLPEFIYLEHLQVKLMNVVILRLG